MCIFQDVWSDGTVVGSSGQWRPGTAACVSTTPAIASVHAQWSARPVNQPAVPASSIQVAYHNNHACLPSTVWQGSTMWRPQRPAARQWRLIECCKAQHCDGLKLHTTGTRATLLPVTTSCCQHFQHTAATNLTHGAVSNTTTQTWMRTTTSLAKNNWVQTKKTKHRQASSHTFPKSHNTAPHCRVSSPLIKTTAGQTSHSCPRPQNKPTGCTTASS